VFTQQSEDLFPNFNQNKADEIKKKWVNCNKILIIGPPRSGKSFFVNNYLKGIDVNEYVIGLEKREEREDKNVQLQEKIWNMLRDVGKYAKEFLEGVKIDRTVMPEYVAKELKEFFNYRIPKPVLEWINKKIGRRVLRSNILRLRKRG